jgi:hypothetical protein
MPFNMLVAKSAGFKVYEYEASGYKVRVLPPSYTEERAPTDPDAITIDGEPAVLANILCIDFQKDTFSREHGAALVPPQSVIVEAVNSFVTRLRHVARAAQIRPPEFPKGAWRLEYCNDDGTPLEQDGLPRARGSMPAFAVSFTSLTPAIWADIYDLDPDYHPSPWDVLLLDATAELPNIGTSIVLAATALEVFIAGILDQLATEQALPDALWSWITEREDFRQQPTLTEQYDDLLQFFTGHSLKEETALWDSFKNLKQARNTFVHEGTARIGKTPVDIARVGQLIIAATAIIAKIREWVPEGMRWPTYDHKNEIAFTKIIGPPQATQKHTPGPDNNEPQDDAPTDANGAQQ